MRYVADLHLHSKYSRAVSQSMNLETMAQYASLKGLDILSTGDWTHPLWIREIKSKLTEEDGLFKLKDPSADSTSSLQAGSGQAEKIRFLLSVEISSIYSQGRKTRRVHNLIFIPSIESAEKINAKLLERGANLSSDGRPIIGLSSKNLLELVLGVDKDALFIPAHAWTPWFSLYGSNSGFDSITECFEDLSKYIYGIETGLSSDPEMNWRIKELKNRSILSFSDAHSPLKMGREATIFELKSLSYENLRSAITNSSKSQNRITGTIEFYPEEGKYHYTGHRNCGISQTPQETKEQGVLCPTCKRSLTVGVLHRVEQLAQPNLKFENLNLKLNERGARWIYDPRGLHPPFVKLVPLIEIISEALESTTASLRVKNTFTELCNRFGSELNILLKTEIGEIAKINEKIAQGLLKVRTGDIVIKPGYDGEYGKVKIWPDADKVAEQRVKKEEQMGLF